jgi:transcriptional regulator with GAF, ATPase, and Fis domain
MVQDGHFRADLWYRINVFPIDLPALRERPTDIAALAEHFAERAAIRLGLPLRRPTPEDIGLLTAYRWPGNVRELASVIERAAILGNGGQLEIATALGAGLPLLEPRTEADAEPQPLPESATTLEALVRARIETALAQAHGRVEGPFGAARQLAINPNTLRARMRKLGIDWRRYRSDAR